MLKHRDLDKERSQNKLSMKCDVIGRLGLRPEQWVADYFANKICEQQPAPPPKVDVVCDSEEMLYIRNLREYQSMQKAQKILVENSKQQAVINGERTEEMYMIQKGLRKRFIQVNAMIKECADKKRVALESIAKESNCHKQLLQDIDHVKTSLEVMKFFSKIFRKTLGKFLHYENVMKEVVAESHIFVNNSDCMARCDALMIAQVEISGLISKKLLEILEMRNQMIQITNDAALAVVGLQNTLCKLERSYNEAYVNCHAWEKHLGRAKIVTDKQIVEKSDTIDGIQELSKVLMRRHGTDFFASKWHSASSLELLDFINEEFFVLSMVINEMEKDKGGNYQSLTLRSVCE